ncbi:MAG TPA: hypothetical protein VFB39_16845 [Solirubrobacteraceae bacterium]|nr:hypothetical protein [Solirubrobacteraceae bacterium]
MPRRNRVSPLGEFVSTEQRGLVFGNRGCLHDTRGQIRRPYATKRWIACRLRFRGRRRAPLMAAGRYTELFLLDEATALAAGHRPCAECRRADYDQLRALWSELHPDQIGADAIDAQLHAERMVLGTSARRFHDAPFAELPDGAFVMHDGGPCIVVGPRLLTWSPGGYLAAHRRPADRQATVITPPSLVELLRTDRTPLVAFLHPSHSLLVPCHGSSDHDDWRNSNAGEGLLHERARQRPR